MANATAADRYAEAMIEIAAEADVVDRIGQDLASFNELMAAHDGLLGGALGSPIFTLEERRQVLDQLLPKVDMHPLSANLVRLANDKGRLGLLGAIAEAYAVRADERAGRIRVVVQTAEAMSEQLERDVRKALEAQTGKTVVLQAEVVPELIGGMVARVGGKVYDSSVKSRLHQIKSALLTGTTPAQA